MAVVLDRPSSETPPAWVKVVDHTLCIGCHACSTACKSEHEVPLGVQRTYVKYVDVGTFPQTRRAFQVTRCNQCERAPCVAICPTGAMYSRPDGIVDFDKSRCIGCKACIAACPYDAIFINPVDHAAEKCNFCAHRIEMGLEPACVVACPTQALLVGDGVDGTSRVARMIGREPLVVRRPEKGTRPKLLYRGAHQATLDPLGARRPEGGLYVWSEQPRGADEVGAGVMAGQATVAHAVLAYDVSHRAPWDWRVGASTWSKTVAAGTYVVAALMVAAGELPAASPLWQWGAPGLAAVFLAVTTLLLIADLERPGRFLLVLTRARWQSWLVRGTVLLCAFGGVLAVHLAGSLARFPALAIAVAWPGVPVGVAAAVYTAYLLAQARARDAWQNPLLPVHLLAQAALAGSAALVLVAVQMDETPLPALVRVVGWSAFAHLGLLAVERSVPPPTTHAGLVRVALARGPAARFFWAGMTLVGAGALLAPFSAAGPALVLLGLLGHALAVVEAGQAAPLA